jgi:RNA polymerase sigma factor (sigma-70 family)
MNPEELFLKHKHIARETLFRMYPDPKGIARKYNIEFADLLQYSLEGLWKAALKYDSSKCKFTTYAINYIKWNLVEKLNRECSLFKINPNNHDWDNMYEIISMDTEMTDIDGRKFTQHDILPSDVDVEIDAISDLSKDYILHNLNDKQKEILKLQEQGMSYKQIGDMWNCTGANVKAKIYNARKQLKNYSEVI